MKKISSIAVMGALAAGMMLNPPLFAEETVTPIEKLVSEMADKPEDHAAIAKYYQDKAASARAEAATHRKMADMPVGHSKSPLAQQNWRAHCENLATSLESAAKEYDALAQLHGTSAK